MYFPKYNTTSLCTCLVYSFVLNSSVRLDHIYPSVFIFVQIKFLFILSKDKLNLKYFYVAVIRREHPSY